MSKPKIIVTRRWHEDVEQVLLERYDTTLNEDDHSMSVAELQQALREAEVALGIARDGEPVVRYARIPLRRLLVHLAGDSARSALPRWTGVYSVRIRSTK